MKIDNPTRDAETITMFGNSVNRVDIEAGVFQRENMEYLTGEYESFLYGNETENTLRISVEYKDYSNLNKKIVENNFLSSFLRKNNDLKEKYYNDEFEIIFNFLKKGKLEFYKIKGRPKRLIDRR